MTDTSTPADSPRRDPDPRGPFGNPDLVAKGAKGDDRADADRAVVATNAGLSKDTPRTKEELDPPVIDATDPDDLPSPIANELPCVEPD